MDTLRRLRIQLSELLAAQQLVIRELAQLILQIPGIVDSQVYGLVLRNPPAFLCFLRAQARLSGHDLAVEVHADDNLTAQVNELRTFMHIHLRRVNLHADPRYVVVSRGFLLPSESQNLEFADAFLTAADALGLVLPNASGNLVPFARAFLSAAGRSRPGFSQLIRSGGTPALAVAWFVISLYTGSPHMCNYAAIVSADDNSSVQVFGSVIHTLAAAITNGSLGDIGDVAKQFQRAAGVNISPLSSLPHGLEVFSLDLWRRLTFSEQEIASLLGTRIKQHDQELWYRICRFEDAFFTYCRQIQAGGFDSSAFHTQEAINLTQQLMNFILQVPDLQVSIEGVRFLHSPRTSPPEMRPSDVREWNASLFARWQAQAGHDDDEDIDIMTDRIISNQLLEMAASTRFIDVQVLATQQLPSDTSASFPGYQGLETSDTTAGQEQDFNDVCLFCITRLCNPGESCGEAVYTLSCCGKQVGEICFQAYKSESSSCPFCSQAL